MVDYHNHTYLCGHASGDPEEYITSAIKNGIREYGFSDHAPLPPHLRKGITMSPDEAESYIELVLGYKKSYAGKIEIKLGFEVDFPVFDDFDKAYYTDERIDYFIGSCHFLGNWPFDHDLFIGEFDKRDIDEVYLQYYKIISSLVDSGLFDIVGHFDLVKKFGHRANRKFDDIISEIGKKICKSDMAMEINTAGLLKPVKEIYPSEDIIEIMFNNNVPVTLGSDSHRPEDVNHEFPKIIEMIKKTGYRKVSGFTKRKRHEILL